MSLCRYGTIIQIEVINIESTAQLAIRELGRKSVHICSLEFGNKVKFYPEVNRHAKQPLQGTNC